MDIATIITGPHFPLVGEQWNQGRGWARFSCNITPMPLTDIELPAEAIAWIEGMDSGFRRATEHMLAIVGAETFVRHWETYRDDVARIEYDFAVT